MDTGERGFPGTVATPGNFPMTQTSLAAHQVYDTAPLGSLIRFSDGTPEPPARHRRKHAAWSSLNGTGRLVRKAPANHVSVPSFTLHVA